MISLFSYRCIISSKGMDLLAVWQTYESDQATFSASPIIPEAAA
jgi:hypothetical protein